MEAAAAAEGWQWAETITESWISYDATARYGRVYPVEGELSEEQAERYDELAELDVLQAILDGGFTPEQKAHAGIIGYVRNEGDLILRHGFVRPEDNAAAVEAGTMQENRHDTARTAAADKPRSPWSGVLIEDMKAVRLHAGVLRIPRAEPHW